MTGAPVLVVDDDPKIVTLVCTYLERHKSWSERARGR